MKAIKLIVLAAMCMAGSYASAQDLIVKKDGSVIQAKVTKIGTTEVEYKKWSNQDGPQYSIAVADILAINYQNGEKETFENVSAGGNGQPAKSEADGQLSIVQVKPEDLSPKAKAANDALIAKYNAPVGIQSLEHKSNKASYAYGRFHISDNSVLSSEDIEISLKTGFMIIKNKKEAAAFEPFWSFIEKCVWTGNPAFYFNIKNKTKNTIFIDLGNTFYVSLGNTNCLYVPSSTTVTSSVSSGGSVNLGAVANILGIGGAAGAIANGINVGGGSSTGVSNTTYSQRYIAVAPFSSVDLTPQYVFGTKTKELFGGCNYTDKGINNVFYCYANFSPEKPLTTTECCLYSNEQTPMSFSFIIAYSKTEESHQLTIQTVNMYLGDLYGNKAFEKMQKGSMFNKKELMFHLFVESKKSEKVFPKQ